MHPSPRSTPRPRNAALVGLAVLSLLTVGAALLATHAGAEEDATAAALAHLEQGKTLQRAQQTDEAMAAYRAAIEADPTLAAAYWELGWSHYVRRELDEVIRLWEKTLELEPGHAEAPGELTRVKEEKRLQEAAARAAEAGAAAAPPARPEDVGDARVLIAAVGDTMMGTEGAGPGRVPADDARGMLDEVAPTLQAADIAFANLEGTFADSGTSSKCRPDSEKCYAFRMPTRLAPRLVEAGIDVVSIANNHANDYGLAGRKSTIATLDELGIAHTGPIGDLATLEHDGLSIGFVAMATSPGLYSINDLDQARAVVSEMDASHDIVVVSFHGGAEGNDKIHVPEGTERAFGENRGNLREFSHAVIDAGADLVLGHGPHVPRGLQLYRNRLIAYSLGNFFTYRFNVSNNLGIGPLLLVYLDEHGAFVEGEIVPTRQVWPGGPILDPDRAAIPLLQRLSTEDFGDTAPIITDDGKVRPR